ncbi:MAG: mannosyltransferase B-like protein, partial [uncultured bacterium]
MKNNPRDELPKPDNNFKYKIIKGFLWSQIFLPLNLYLKKQVDVFFSPAHYTPRFCPIPMVVTIHDLSYFYYPEEFLKKDFYQLKNWTKYSVKKARKIIAVSQTTKNDLIKFYQAPKEKIEVIYNGYNNSQKLNSDVILKDIPKLYFLYVGTLQPRKNLNTLLDAFCFLLKERQAYRLIIVGKKGWLWQDIFAKVADLKLNNKVIFMGYLTDNELSFLYKNASIFILPSFYEGFGIPILEAMSFNCPVIASNASSLPEIGGDACLYFNPKNPQELKVKIIELLTNQVLRDELVKKGQNRVKLFSWQRCGEETLKT